MAKPVKNSSRIRSKFRTGGLLWAVLIAAFAMSAVALAVRALRRPSSYAVTGGLLAGGVILVLCAVIALISSGSRTRKVLKQVDDRESFDADHIVEAGSSKFVFLGEDWLVWNKGNTYRIVKKDDIVSADIHPQSSSGNDLGLLLVEKKDGSVLQLTYDIVDGIDLPSIINEWCRGPVVPEAPEAGSFPAEATV